MILVFIPTQWSFGIKPRFSIMGAAVGMGPGEVHILHCLATVRSIGVVGILLGGFWALFASFLMLSFIVKDYIKKFFYSFCHKFCYYGKRCCI